jgi:hypothetical protein
MNDAEKLAVLADTIAKHAREVVGRRWADIHRPALVEIFSKDHESMIRIGERELPIKVVIESLRADFVERNTKLLIEKITQEVVKKAYRSIEESDD